MPTLKTQQVYNLFHESVVQPPLGFRIAEEKKQTVLKNHTFSKTCGTFGTTKPVTNPVIKPLKTEKENKSHSLPLFTATLHFTTGFYFCCLLFSATAAV